ncbi:hypothetical protein [Pseudoalteromonas obscura]|uniref:Uncharacterized protein n=1 Tax=Pseudoalteromonas obscura TaxID=3048491 RepID=A0ABT7EIP1_9GAMM|nr:hypothetical protein [Pseudoalteromonas sp. P94(2023)]MDK2594926.1 hypothetical protein [Pseudoalteromonas sp. P94(2023)]
MTIKSYPLVLIFDQSIEYVDSPQALQESVFYLTEKQIKTTTCIFKDGSASTLNGDPITLDNFSNLTPLVQQKLASEGHCCTAKIHITDIEQVFSLMAETV